jgi:ribokinase
MLETLSAHRLETDGVPQRDIQGIHNRVVYSDSDSRTWFLESNPDDFFALSPALEDIPISYLEARGYLILAMDLAAQEALVPGLRTRGLVALDPQEDYIAGNERRLFQLIEKVDIFMPSLEEVRRLLGHQGPEEACRKLAALGPGMVVIKLGSAGSIVYERAADRCLRIPACPGRVVDTTGAGDAYCGGFLSRYLQTGDPLQAGLAGAVSASFAVEDFGLEHMFSVTQEQAKARLAGFLQILT